MKSFGFHIEYQGIKSQIANFAVKVQKKIEDILN